MKTTVLPVAVLTLLASSSPAPAPPAAEASYRESIYKRIGEIELKMRIYRPDGWKATDRRPALVFFLGGGWRGGTPQQFDPHCRHLAGLGMMTLAAEYRIQSRHDSTPFESTKDAKSAVRWIRAHAGELGIDPGRVGAGGGSAGGHLAAATATVGDDVVEDSDDRSVSAVPDVLVLFNPALDLTIPAVKERWGPDLFAKIRTISPQHQVDGSLPPTLIFHGTGDTTVAFATAEAFVAKARKLGARQVRLQPYEGRSHGFFNFGRDGGADYEDTVAKMDAFLRELGWIE